MKNLFVSWIAPKKDQFGHHVLLVNDGYKMQTIADICNIRAAVAEQIQPNISADEIIILNWKWMDA